jgi:hypothetical protein
VQGGRVPVAGAAFGALEKDMTGRHELAGPDNATSDEASVRPSGVRGGG